MQQRLNPAQDKLYNAILQHENITDKLEQLEVWNEVYFDDLEYYFAKSYRELGRKIYTVKYAKSNIPEHVKQAISFESLGILHVAGFKDLIKSHGLVYRRDE